MKLTHTALHKYINVILAAIMKKRHFTYEIFPYLCRLEYNTQDIKSYP